MLPADVIAEITTNLAALQLEANTAAQILAAIFAPLLRSGPPELKAISGELPHKRVRARKARQRKKTKRRAARSREAHDRARAALRAHPGETVSAVAKAAGVSRSTVIAARGELAAEARKEARRKPPAKAAEPAERRERAQRFLREQLGRGPKPVSDIEAAASRAHVDEVALGQARADLGIVTTRPNTGGVHAVQWSLPG